LKFTPGGCGRGCRGVRVPLAEGDPDVLLDLQAVLAQTYEAGV
jgi:hypothetical protein